MAPRALRFVAPIAVPIILAGLICAGVSMTSGRSISDWLGLLTGRDVLEVEPSPVFSCEARQGEIVDANFTVRNPSNRAITVLGSNSSCGCAVVEGLPVEISPHKSAVLRLRVKIGRPDSDGKFTRSADLLINREGNIPSLIFHATLTP
jgi:hypothetical protein